MSSPSVSSSATKSNSSRPQKRPPYISIACLVVWISALFIGFLAIETFFSRSNTHLNLQIDDLATILLAGVIVVSFTLSGIGLWRMKKWGIAVFWLGFSIAEIPSYLEFLQNQKTLSICLAVFQITVFAVISVALWRAMGQQRTNDSPLD